MAEDSIPHPDKARRQFFLYWLRDASCTDISVHGYVGVTCRLKAREKDHRKTGRFPPDFVMEVIFAGPQPECLQKERALRHSPGIGWNLAVGGPGGYMYGHTAETRAKIGAASRKMRPEARYKIGDANRGVPRSAEHNAKISKALTGKKASLETRAKLSASHLGKRPSPEAIQKSRQANLGRRHSPEVRAKLSEIARNRSPEYWAKVGAAQCGKKKTPEHIEKISASRRGKPWSETAREAHRGRHKWTEERHAKMAVHLAKMQAGRIGTKHSPEAIAKIKAANARRNAARAALRKDELHAHAHEENLSGRSSGETQRAFAFD